MGCYFSAESRARWARRSKKGMARPVHCRGTDINDLGHVVGWCVTGNFAAEGFVWLETSIIRLGSVHIDNTIEVIGWKQLSINNNRKVGASVYEAPGGGFFRAALWTYSTSNGTPIAKAGGPYAGAESSPLFVR